MTRKNSASNPAEQKTTHKKISEWLDDLGSHEIFDSVKLSENFVEETGAVPCWPEHTIQQTRAAIEARGLGGELKPDAAQLSAYGWEIAEALAFKYGNYGGSRAMGRGRRFWDAVAALKKAGL